SSTTVIPTKLHLTSTDLQTLQYHSIAPSLSVHIQSLSQLTSLHLLSGCASVLNTHSSKLILPGSSKIKNRYFNVSASQKLSWSLLFDPPALVTSFMAL